MNAFDNCKFQNQQQKPNTPSNWQPQSNQNGPPFNQNPQNGLQQQIEVPNNQMFQQKPNQSSFPMPQKDVNGGNFQNQFQIPNQQNFFPPQNNPNNNFLPNQGMNNNQGSNNNIQNQNQQNYLQRLQPQAIQNQPNGFQQTFQPFQQNPSQIKIPMSQQEVSNLNPNQNFNNNISNNNPPQIPNNLQQNSFKSPFSVQPPQNYFNNNMNQLGNNQQMMGNHANIDKTEFKFGQQPQQMSNQISNQQNQILGKQIAIPPNMNQIPNQAQSIPPSNNNPTNIPTNINNQIGSIFLPNMNQNPNIKQNFNNFVMPPVPQSLNNQPNLKPQTDKQQIEQIGVNGQNKQITCTPQGMNNQQNNGNLYNNQPTNQNQNISSQNANNPQAIFNLPNNQPVIHNQNIKQQPQTTYQNIPSNNNAPQAIKGGDASVNAYNQQQNNLNNPAVLINNQPGYNNNQQNQYPNQNNSQNYNLQQREMYERQNQPQTVQTGINNTNQNGQLTKNNNQIQNYPIQTNQIPQQRNDYQQKYTEGTHQQQPSFPQSGQPKQEKKTIYPIYHFDHSYDSFTNNKCSNKKYRLICGHFVCLESFKAYLEKKILQNEQMKFATDENVPSYKILCPFYVGPEEFDEQGVKYEYDDDITNFRKCAYNLTQDDYKQFRKMDNGDSIFENFTF